MLKMSGPQKVKRSWKPYFYMVFFFCTSFCYEQTSPRRTFVRLRFHPAGSVCPFRSIFSYPHLTNFSLHLFQSSIIMKLRNNLNIIFYGIIAKRPFCPLPILSTLGFDKNTNSQGRFSYNAILFKLFRSNRSLCFLAHWLRLVRFFNFTKRKGEIIYE